MLCSKDCLSKLTDSVSLFPIFVISVSLIYTFWFRDYRFFAYYSLQQGK